MSEKATADGLCPVCGTPGPESGQSFCDVCGTLIDWDTTRSPEAASPSAAEEASNRGRAAAGPDLSAASETAAASEESRLGGQPGDGSPAAGRTTAATDPETGDGGDTAVSGATSAASPQREGGDSASDGQQRARALLVPVPDAEPAQQGVGAVLPGRPVPARPNVRDVRADDESGIVCPRCRVDNRPDRLFCRNDGTPLTGVNRPEATLPGRQRLAGWRPRLPWKRVLIIAGVASALIGAAFLTPVVIRAVNDHFSDAVPLAPTAVSASNADASHPAQAAFDGVSNTWWGTGYSGDSAGQYLQANYVKPVRLEKLIVTPGASYKVEDRSQARPERVDVLLTDVRGRRAKLQYRLADGGAQMVNVEMDDVVQIDMIVRSAYGTADTKQVAIAEVEVFGRS